MCFNILISLYVLLAWIADWNGLEIFLIATLRNLPSAPLTEVSSAEHTWSEKYFKSNHRLYNPDDNHLHSAMFGSNNKIFYITM